MDTFSLYARQLSVRTSTYRGKLASLMLLQFQSKYDMLSKLHPALTTSPLYELLNRDKITESVEQCANLLLFFLVQTGFGVQNPIKVVIVGLPHFIE